MEAELQELRDLVAQLRADNEWLRQEQTPVVVPGPSVASTATAGPSVMQQPTVASAPLSDRFVFVPRDRKCPKFSGRSGITINEWVEEAQACMRARHLSVADQAFFLFDHLEGEARDEIRYRSDIERGDPEKNYSGFKGVVWLFLVSCSVAAGLFLQEATGGRDVVRILHCIDGPPGESETAVTSRHTKCRNFIA